MNTRGRVAVFQGVLTVAAEQPCGVQVVEQVGLVTGSFHPPPLLPPCLRRRSAASVCLLALHKISMTMQLKLKEVCFL